jgi:hypothetical protein
MTMECGTARVRTPPYAEYTTVNSWYIEMFTVMLQKVKAIDEGNGSLSDYSILQYGSGMRYGISHI